MTATERPDLRAEVEIIEQRTYRGPNFWAYGPCIRMLVDLHSAEAWPTSDIDGFADRLAEMFPDMVEHTCGSGERGGFFERVQRGTWLGHVAEHIAIELQSLCGHDVSRGKTRSTDEAGRYQVIFDYKDETVGREAGRLAVQLVNHLVEAADIDPDEEVNRLIRLAQRAAFGPSTQAILDEAASRDIPFMRLDEHSLVQLGQGVHAKRIRATMTSNTSALAVDVASDKELTAQLLAAAGLPVPSTEAFSILRGALRYAERLGWPVVVKPLDGNHGRGVGLNLQNPQEFEEAYDVAKSESRNGYVVVERYVPGNDYRFLVVDGRLVACAERTPAHVIGDGTQTVRELVEETNRDPRRGIGHEKVLTRIRMDEAAEELVREQGYSGFDAVVEEGERVLLAQTANMSTGGISIDRTMEAHPDNVEIAEQAARVVGLDIAGIDFIAPDISKPVREAGGAICEVNAAPGFRMHTHPTIGEPQFVAKPVLDMLFPTQTTARIPITAVTGTNGKTTTSRMLAHILKNVGTKVGMTSTNGIVIDERLVMKADASGPRSARMVLQNPVVEHAVLEVARGGLLREGLGYERNDVGIVTNVASDHLGRNGVNTLEDLAKVKQIVVEAIPRDGFAVLNADDELVAGMRHECRGEIVFFSLDPDNEHVERHARRGGRVITLEQRDLGEMIVWKHGRRTMDIVHAHLLPSTFGGRARMNVANAMAAAAAAIVHGVHLQDVRQGLRSFTTSYAFAPGRLNVMEVAGFHAIVDYCHNAHGMRFLGDFVERVVEDRPESEQGRRICVAAVPGDRRDEDLIEFATETAKYFDEVIIREDEHKRGRAEGEVAEILATAMREAGASGARCEKVEIMLDELDATRAAMERANRHDVVVFCSDDVDGAWNAVQEFRAAREGSRPFVALGG